MSLFQFVKSKVAILEVAREYVQLRPIGGYWKGPCPFHSETDASFTVSPEKQIFYCFGCHAGGDVIAFIAKAEHCTQLEGAQHIIERYGLQVPNTLLATSVADQQEQAKERNAYFHSCQEAAAWMHEELAMNASARDYLTSRGIDQAQIDYFQIGYLPGGLRAINRLTKVMAQKNVLAKELIEAGLLMEGSGNVLFSPFEERIIFPIRDHLGRHCAFGGRIFKPRDDRAKYYNSKESAAFSKGKILFGFDLAKKEIQQKNYAFLVEGYTDCVAMVAKGFRNTVATLGTACTIDHLTQLARHCNKLYVLYDGDNAGQKAILRLAQFCFEASLELHIIRLPPQDDPASFLGAGGDLAALMSKSREIFTFFVESLGGGFADAPLAQKLELAQKIIAVVVKVTDSFKRDLLLQKASEALQVPFAALQKLCATGRAASLRTPLQEVHEKQNEEENVDQVPPKPAQTTTDGLKQVPGLEKTILFAMINNAADTDQQRLVVGEDIIQYFSPEIQFFMHELHAVIETQAPDKRFSAFLGRLEGERQAWVMQHSLQESEKVGPQAFEHLCDQFRRKKWKIIVRDIRAGLLEAQSANDGERSKELLKRFLGLKQDMKRKGLL